MATTVITDKSDYGLYETANITASGYVIGSTIEFLVQHIIDWGEDGIWGTADDELGYNGGEGHLPWRVTDGGDGDEDGIANGIVKTTWYVGDDSHNEKFRLTALGAGLDGLFSTDGIIDNELGKR